MKSIKIFAVASAVALLSTAGFTSCNQKNGPDIDPVTGNYNGEVVKTEFMINIAENVAGRSNGTYYMPGTTVQKNQNIASFRGMDSIRLVPYRDNDYEHRIGKTIVLTPIDAAGLNEGSQSKLYTNVSIPLGTENFLFYGKAIDNAAGTAITSVSDMHEFGRVKATGLYTGQPEIGGIYFDLQPIYESGAVDQKATDLATYLTSIANATDGSTAWGDHGNAGIKKLHDDFITMKAGSSASIQSLVQDLYNSLQRFQSQQVSADATVTAVIAAIAAGTDGTGSISGGSQDPFTPYTVVLKDDLKGYPGNINLPDGAAVVTWNTPTANQFNVTVNSTMGSMTTSSLAHYAYPVSLQYFAKSTIKTDETSKKSMYEDGSSIWSAILDAYDQGTSVATNTKSVAIVEPIDYGVGQLKVNVKRNSSLKDQKNESYVITNPLKWKAVLVGDQKRVNYMFEYETSLAVTDVYTIYDNFLNGTTPATLNGEVEIGTDFDDAKENYTLVFGTKDNAVGEAPYTPGNDAVYVAIEMINTNKAFYGVGGQIIPAGGTFYLVGKLDASVATAGVVDKTNHPVKYNIFYKDYVTTAKFTITSLANAYNTIPDLRSSELELGFSVDLEWKAGLIFNIDL